MRKRKNLLCSVIFLVLLLLVFSGLQKIFAIDKDNAYHRIVGFYKEKNGSMDAVYIGGSNVDYFWEPPFAWGDHGIAVWSFSSGAMPALAVRGVMEEASKTQPDALYIVNLNTFKSTGVYAPALHRVVDYMPLSLNKIRMVNRLADAAGMEGLDRLECFFPSIRFHSRWNELKSLDFLLSINGMKGGIVNTAYISSVEDLSDRYNAGITGTEPLTDEQAHILEDLLDYCDQTGRKVLFVTVPQVLSADEQYKQLNSMEEMIRARGYTCLDLLEAVDDTGIQVSVDFCDTSHTNVHGSLKFTEYLAQYLKENYGFTDKRGQPGWESWDESVGLYANYIGPYTLPFEREHAPRDYSLSVPELSALEISGQQISLQWESAEDADGYEIYRKSAGEQNGCWHAVASVNAETLRYEEEDLAAKTKYTYTVVPYRTEADIKYYGNFSYVGVTGTTE